MSDSSKMPTLFVGHGSPMNALENNPWSRGFKALGKLLPRPTAILSVSAHWYVEGTRLTATAHPRTIHDFYGFPEELYQMSYPAPGSPELAARAAALLGESASLTEEWGIDHGTWSVLLHAYPGHDIPVVQLSIDGNLPPQAHLEIGRALAPLRNEGVLIMGSGNMVHNLPYVFSRTRAGEPTPDWAERFDLHLAEALLKRDAGTLVEALDTPDGRMSHPTPDHYLPLLYVAGAAEGGTTSFPLEGFDLGSISMRAALIT